MKKIITLLLFAALFCAVSCQHGLDNGQDLSNGLKVEAVISQFGDTRVDYIPQNSEEPYYIDAVWHVGDVIFGFDDQGQKFDFTVESVAAGVATLNIGSYVPGAATTLHAIYYPGKSSTDLEGDSPNYSLPVNLDAQSGELDGDSPVLMCATSAISAGSVSFTFNSETAIIGVTRFKLPADATITSIELEGVVTRGTIAVDGGGSLVLTPDGTPRTITTTGSWPTSGTVCNTPVYFASLPTTTAALKLYASDGSTVYSNTNPLSSTTLDAGYYYYTQKVFNAVDVVARIGFEHYATIDDAWDAANKSTSDVTINIMADCSTVLPLSITDDGSGSITLDLNGHVLTASAEPLISIGQGKRNITITDSRDKVGKITSSGIRVIEVAAWNNTTTLLNCIIECTKASGAWEDEPVVRISEDGGATSSLMNISGSRIITTNQVTGVAFKKGRITITNSEITSGQTSPGNYVIVCNFGSSDCWLVINSGSFYTSTTGSLPSTLHRASKNGTITVNDGYFFSNARVVSKGSSVTTANAKFNIKGGYYSKSPEGDLNITYTGSLKSLDPKATHVHQTTGKTLEYSYQVK